MNDFRKNLRGNVMTTDQINGLVLDRTNEVKRAGYRSAQDQINELLRSGQRLQQAREEQYSKPSGIMPRMYGEVDRTVATEKNEAIKEGIKERREKAQAEAAKKAENEAHEQKRGQTSDQPQGSEQKGDRVP